MDRFKEFQENYDDAIKTITQMTYPGPYEPQMDGLVKWMMNTTANPYGFIPSYGGVFGSAEAFAGLLRSIHHALYDDGDITFVTVDGEPRIVMAWKHEENFRDLVLTDIEKNFERDPFSIGTRRTYDIQILDIDPDAFGPLYDEYQAQFRKKWEHFETMMDKIRERRK